MLSDCPRITSAFSFVVAASAAWRLKSLLRTYFWTITYRYVRHPLYTAGILFVMALTVLTALWWVGVAFALPLVILIFRTQREEALLIEHFGDAYRAYMQRTGRFLPRWRN